MARETFADWAQKRFGATLKQLWASLLAVGVPPSGDGTTFLNDQGSFAAPAGGGPVTEADLSLSDNTTANASTTKHGLLKKLPNDDTKILDGLGNWVAKPAGGGGTPGGDPGQVQFNDEGAAGGDPRFIFDKTGIGFFHLGNLPLLSPVSIGNTYTDNNSGLLMADFVMKTTSTIDNSDPTLFDCEFDSYGTHPYDETAIGAFTNHHNGSGQVDSQQGIYFRNSIFGAGSVGHSDVIKVSVANISSGDYGHSALIRMLSPYLGSTGKIIESVGLEIDDQNSAGADYARNIWSKGLTAINRLEGPIVGMATVPPSLGNGEFTFSLDESGNRILWTVKYSDGTSKTGAIALT